MQNFSNEQWPKNCELLEILGERKDKREDTNGAIFLKDDMATFLRKKIQILKTLCGTCFAIMYKIF